MAWRITKISTKGDAVALIRYWTGLIYVLAVIQTVVALLMGGASLGAPELVRYFLPAGGAFDAFLTAVFIASLAFVILKFCSRTAAVLLLALSVAILFSDLVSQQRAHIHANLFLAFVMIWGAARLSEATFKLHGRFKEAADESHVREPPRARPSPQPNPDFMGDSKRAPDSMSVPAGASASPWIASRKMTAFVAIAGAAAVAAYIGWDTRLNWLPTFFPSDYDRFVRLVRDICTDGEQKRPAPGLNRARVNAFCACYAEALAKELSAQELDVALKERGQRGDIPPELREKVMNAAPACRHLAFGR